MIERKWIQIGGLAGALFVALIVASSVITGNMPSINASTAKIATYIIDHRHAVLVSDIFTVAAEVFVLWFAGTLARILRARDARSPLGMILLVSGAAAATAAGISALPNTALAFMAVQSQGLTNSSVTRMLFDFSSVLYGVVLIMVALFLTALGVAMIGRTFAASWLGWLSAAIAIVCVVGGVVTLAVSNNSAMLVIDYIGLIGFGVVVLATSIFMLRYREVVPA